MNAFLIVDTKQAIGGTGSPAPLKETSNQAHRQRRSRDSNLQMQAQASLRGTRHIAAARTQHRMRACVRACVRSRALLQSKLHQRHVSRAASAVCWCRSGACCQTLSFQQRYVEKPLALVMLKRSTRRQEI